MPERLPQPDGRSRDKEHLGKGGALEPLHDIGVRKRSQHGGKQTDDAWRPGSSVVSGASPRPCPAVPSRPRVSWTAL
jgi:hypothetical protein